MEPATHHSQKVSGPRNLGGGTHALDLFLFSSEHQDLTEMGRKGIWERQKDVSIPRLYDIFRRNLLLECSSIHITSHALL